MNYDSGSPTKILHIVHNTEFPMSTFASLENGSCLIADKGFDSVLSKLKGFYEPRKGAKIEVSPLFLELWFTRTVSLQCICKQSKNLYQRLPSYFAVLLWLP